MTDVLTQLIARVDRLERTVQAMILIRDALIASNEPGVVAKARELIAQRARLCRRGIDGHGHCLLVPHA